MGWCARSQGVSGHPFARPCPLGAGGWASRVGWCTGSRGVCWGPLSQAPCFSCCLLGPHVGVGGAFSSCVHFPALGGSVRVALVCLWFMAGTLCLGVVLHVALFVVRVSRVDGTWLVPSPAGCSAPPVCGRLRGAHGGWSRTGLLVPAAAPLRRVRWARSVLYPFRAPLWVCPWRVSPASVWGFMRCRVGVFVDLVTLASGFPYRPPYCGVVGWCTWAVLRRRRLLPLLVAGRHARVRCVRGCVRVSWPRWACRPPNPFCSVSPFLWAVWFPALFRCPPPPGLGLPCLLLLAFSFLLFRFSRCGPLVACPRCMPSVVAVPFLRPLLHGLFLFPDPVVLALGRCVVCGRLRSLPRFRPFGSFGPRPPSLVSCCFLGLLPPPPPVCFFCLCWCFFYFYFFVFFILFAFLFFVLFLFLPPPRPAAFSPRPRPRPLVLSGAPWCGAVPGGLLCCAPLCCAFCVVLRRVALCRRRCYQKAMAVMSTHGYR